MPRALVPTWLPVIAVPEAVPETTMPPVELPLTTLRCAAVVPPMVVPDPALTVTPAPLGTAVAPDTFVPIQLPRIVCPPAVTLMPVEVKPLITNPETVDPLPLRSRPVPTAEAELVLDLLNVVLTAEAPRSSTIGLELQPGWVCASMISALTMLGSAVWSVIVATL